jgi:hypothetical protein
MMESAMANLVGRASFIFAGTVTSLGESSLRVLPSRPGLAVSRFDRGFLINPVLGNLAGRPITVQLTRDATVGNTSMRGQRLIFFTTAWVHGEEIAVNELASLPDTDENEQEVARIVASLPERHLGDRIAAALLIVHGRVTKIERATDIPRTASEHDPYWMRAWIEVIEVLKGKADRPNDDKHATVALLFPGNRDIAFRNYPRPSLHQEAVFLLHRGAGPSIPATAYVGPDPADIQPVTELQTIRRLLGAK